MRSAFLVRTRFILNIFSVIGLGVPGPPPLGYAPGCSSVSGSTVAKLTHSYVTVTVTVTESFVWRRVLGD